MKKLAIVLDSFSARTKKNVESRPDHYYLPLKLIVNGKEYVDGTTHSATELMNLSNKAIDVKTSQPSPADMENLFNKISKEYENVIYLSVGTALSGTYTTAMAVVKKYKNIFPINGFLVGKGFDILADHLMTNKETPIDKLVEVAKEYSQRNPAFVIPKTMDAFIRGGRLGKVAGFIMSRARAVPVIGYENTDKLKKRIIKISHFKAVKYAIDKLQNSIKDKSKQYIWQITHTVDTELVEIAKKILSKIGVQKTHIELSSALINAHVGDGAISINLLNEV